RNTKKSRQPPTVPRRSPTTTAAAVVRVPCQQRRSGLQPVFRVVRCLFNTGSSSSRSGVIVDCESDCRF
ncbi:hypothetical protein LINPERHAP1_LOCUS19594, partial [Linum perenne]